MAVIVVVPLFITNPAPDGAQQHSAIEFPRGDPCALCTEIPVTAVSTDAVMQQIDSLVRRGAFKPLGRYLKEEDRDDRLERRSG